MADVDGVEDDEGPARSWSVVEPQPRVDLRTDLAHSARIYDYLLGGKDNFPADRAVADQMIATFPTVRAGARSNRDFVVRTTRYLAASGIRQFLDIGTGIPTSPNLHEIAQAVDPGCRVVYVDNDPIVLAHARALLSGRPEGRTGYIDASFLEPEAILTSDTLRDTLDLTQPVALSLIALLHFIPDRLGPKAVVATLVDALPSGSYLSLTNVTTDFAPEDFKRIAEIYARQGIESQPRSRAEFASFFDGLELVDPGITLVHRWRPDPAADGEADYTDAEVSVYGATGRKP